MSRSRSDYLEGHAPTSGVAARYLHAEHPDVPISRLSTRFKHFRETGEIPPLAAADGGHAANYDCPGCGGRLITTDLANAYECEDCGETVKEEPIA